MNLQLIKYFIALANTKNFTRAAEQVFVVQSTFSAGIKKLEDHLGVKLFERDKRNVSLTKAGEALLPQTTELMSQWYAIEEHFKIRSHVEVKLGFVQNININIVLPLINQLKQMNPLSELEIYEEKNDVLQKMLDSNIIHAFFTEKQDFRNSDYQTLEISKEELFFAVHHNHILANKESIELSALHQEPFIERSHCLLYEDAYKEMKIRGVEPKKVFTAHNNETVGALITSGMGITLMPKPFFQMPDVKFIPIKDVKLSREIVLVFKRLSKSTELKALLKLIKDNKR